MKVAGIPAALSAAIFAVVFTCTIPAASLSSLQRVDIEILPCAHQPVSGVTATVSAVSGYAPVNPPEHVSYSAMRAVLKLRLPTGYYSIGMHDERGCHAYVYAAVLPGLDRKIRVTAIKPGVIVLQHTLGAVAGRLPSGIVDATLYSPDEAARPMKLYFDQTAYYIDRLWPGRYILYLRARDGSGAQLGIDSTNEATGTLERRDVTAAEYRAAAASGDSPFNEPTIIRAGIAKRMWYLNPSANAVGSIEMNHTVAEYRLPSFDSVPRDLIASAHYMWVSESRVDKMARIAADGAIVEYALPPASEPQYLALGKDGRVWFSEAKCACLGAIDEAGRLSEYRIPGHRLSSIVEGPDGRIWGGSYDEAVAIDVNGTVTAIPNSGLTERLVAGFSSVWASSGYADDRITEISMDGKLRSYTIPIGNSSPYEMAEDAAGVLWFTDIYHDVLGHIDHGAVSVSYRDTKPVGVHGLIQGPDGKIWDAWSVEGMLERDNGKTLFFAPSHTDPTYLAVGVDGKSVWFTEPKAKAIGIINNGRVSCIPLRGSTLKWCESEAPARRIIKWVPSHVR